MIQYTALYTYSSNPGLKVLRVALYRLLHTFHLSPILPRLLLLAVPDDLHNTFSATHLPSLVLTMQVGHVAIYLHQGSPAPNSTQGLLELTYGE